MEDILLNKTQYDTITKESYDKGMSVGIEKGKMDFLKENGTPEKTFSEPILLSGPQKAEKTRMALNAQVFTAFKTFAKYGAKATPFQLAETAKELSNNMLPDLFGEIYMQYSGKKTVDGQVNKAITENSAADGGYFAIPEYDSQFIDILYAPICLRASGVSIHQMQAASRIVPRGTTGGTAYWADEMPGTEVSESGNKIGRFMATPKKLAAYLRISQDQIDDAYLNVMDIYSKQLLMAMGISEDLAFWLGTGSAFQPLGMLTNVSITNPTGGWLDFTNNKITPYGGTADVTTVAAQLAANATYVEIDIKNAIKAIRNAYVPGKLAIYMNEATFLDLQCLRVATYGTLIFPTLSNTTPTLFGCPIFFTSLTSNPNYQIRVGAPEHFTIFDRKELKVAIDMYQTTISINPDEHLLFMEKRVDSMLNYNRAFAYVAYGGA
jgi:HK97 family phage major capsid protein